MTTLELAVLDAWRTWGHAWMMFTCCTKCGEVKACRGRRRDRMLCLDCFDQS